MIASTDNSLRGVRDKALLSLAYDTLCRRSEIVSLDIEDIIYSNDQLKICLRKSKTDQDALGKILKINSETKMYLLNWLQHSKINTGKLFRALKIISNSQTHSTKLRLIRFIKN